MDRKKTISSIVLIFAMFNILPINGDIICPWCDSNMQTRLLDCVYSELISRPQLIMMPLPEIDAIKWKVSSASDSMVGLTYTDKKVKMDEFFMKTIADAIKRNNYQNNRVVINVISTAAGNCYSSVTGYDPNVVIQDIKKDIIQNIRPPTSPPKVNQNPALNSGRSYSANQNQENNQQQFRPPARPPNRGTGNQPNTARNFPSQLQPSVNGNGYRNPDLQPYRPLYNGPHNPPVLSTGNSFNNPSSGNPSDNPTFLNNGRGPSRDSLPNDYDGQRQSGFDFSNQTPSDSSSGVSSKNDNESQNNDSPDDADFVSTVSISQDSDSTDEDSSDNSNETTQSPITDISYEKTTENDEPEEEEPCEERFKIALYEKLINDNRFCSTFGKLPIYTTKSAVPKIMNHAFKKYGIQQHYSEFSTFWKFESKTLNKESEDKDWDEVMSKICKIIFSRNNLLEDDCEEAGQKMGDYILEMLPGDSPSSSTNNPIQNDKDDETSTESNADSSVPDVNSSTVTTCAPSDNSTNPENLSFPELNSKLANIFKSNGSNEQDSSDVPFSETLTTFETQQNLATLHSAAENCKDPSGFDFKKFLGTMTKITESIQKNHPDWSRDKCEKEMYSVTVAVLTKELQDTLKSSNSNSDGQSVSDQPDSVEDSDSSQIAQPFVPQEYDVSSDDSTNTRTDDSDSDTAFQPQQDFPNQGSYPDETEPVNIPPPRNQPGPDIGLIQPSNFNPGPGNTNYGGFNNGNPQNMPPLANQPFQSNFGSQNNGNAFSRPNFQNFPSQDYPAAPPRDVNPQPFPGNQPFPINPNAGFQRSPNFTPGSGVMNPPNNFGNNHFQGQNPSLMAGPPRPGLSNSQYQNFQPQNQNKYNVPAAGPEFQNGNRQQFNSNSRFPANGPPMQQW